MASVEEAIGRLIEAKDQIEQAVSGCRAAGQAVDRALATCTAARATVGEVVAQLGALGINDKAGQVQSAEVRLEDAESGGSSAKNGNDATIATLLSVTAAVDQAIAELQAAQGLGTSGPGPPRQREPVERIVRRAFDPPTPLTHAPLRERSPRESVGDDATAPPDVAPHPFRQELQGIDEDDTGATRLRRAARIAVRGMADFKSGSEDVTRSVVAIADSIDPIDGTTESTTATGGPVVNAQPAHAAPHEAIGTAVVMTAVAVEGMSRLIRRRRRPDA